MPVTERLDAHKPGDVRRAAELLRAGRLVAFPTETVYGLGANALDAEAVARIFAAKQRPAWDPLITHVASAADTARVAEVPEGMQARLNALAREFWPGPLTLLLPRTAAVPDAVTAGRALVGVRVPQHRVALQLLALAGVPVAAPSANVFGHTSPTTAQHVLDDLEGRIDAVLDGGASTVGVESTVLDPASMTLYRPGGVTAEQIAAVTGEAVSVFAAAPRSQAPEALPSPGVGIRHYAPRARLVLVEPSGDLSQTLLRDSVEHAHAGLLLPEGWAAPPRAHVFAWGPWDDAAELARNLFAGLRSLDERGVDVILAPLPPPGGLRDALRDRLEKAARAE